MFNAVFIVKCIVMCSYVLWNLEYSVFDIIYVSAFYMLLSVTITYNVASGCTTTIAYCSKLSVIL